jgi:2-methylcitrate dehydratase PrpD
LAAVVACRDLEPATLARRFVAKHGAATKAAPILGTRERCGLLDAIFASGMTVHAAEINDFCPSAFTQPGAAIVPAALCLGAVRNLSGERFLRAMIVGYEIACRLPKALGIVNLRNAVLANHSVGPLFGSAAAVASLIELPRERLVHVFSYCVEQASGSWQWLRDVEHVEKAFVFGGMPGRRGAECALLVDAGFTGIGESARVILRLDDGTTHQRFLDHVKGFPAHPFERQDVETKALELMAPHLGAARAGQICAMAWGLESVKSVRQLVQLIAR